MSVRQFNGVSPSIAATAYVDQDAVIIGDVTLAEDVSIWPCAVIRGDVNHIRIGARTNIQDGSVLHVTHASDKYTNATGTPLLIGEDVTVGHKAVLHACTIGNRCLIGMGSVVLDNAVIEDEVMVAAGSVVAPGKTLKSGYLYLGNPAREKRPLNDQERQFLSYSAENYVALAKQM
ncbi:MAG: gamma carbonic anhydrase family protein [Leucothrix sp.]